jgi:hypothetical protein
LNLIIHTINHEDSRKQIHRFNFELQQIFLKVVFKKQTLFKELKKLNNNLQHLPTNVDELISKKRTKKSKSSPMSCSLVDQINSA